MLSLPPLLLQLLNMHLLLIPVFSLISYFSEPCFLTLIPYDLNHSPVSDIFGHILDLVSLDFLTFFVSNAGEENYQSFFKMLFSFLIFYMCFYTRPLYNLHSRWSDFSGGYLSFFFLTNTLFPHCCTFFILLRQITFFCHWPVPFPSNGTPLEQFYYILLATVYSFICMLFLRLHLTL